MRARKEYRRQALLRRLEKGNSGQPIRSAIPITIGYDPKSGEIIFVNLHGASEEERAFLQACIENDMKQQAFRWVAHYGYGWPRPRRMLRRLQK